MDETSAKDEGAEASAEQSAMENVAAAMGGGAAMKGGAEGAQAGEAGDGKPVTDADDTEIYSLDFILDIPLRVSVEVGRARILVRDLLQLGQGSVVELTKFAGEPLEMLVNDKLIARGEVVVVNEKFGLRLTDIISPEERIEQLK